VTSQGNVPAVERNNETHHGDHTVCCSRHNWDGEPQFITGALIFLYSVNFVYTSKYRKAEVY